MNKDVKLDKAETLIIILNYKSYQMTFDLLEDLKKIQKASYDVLVVDNASPNESGAVLRDKASDIGYIFIQSESNGGYAAGNNIGIRYAIENGYKYSLILNNDIKISDPMFLHTMIKCIEKDDSLACVGPQIMGTDGSYIAPYLVEPSLWNIGVGAIATSKKRKANIHSSGYVYRVYGCCILLDNNAMRQVDGFDERTFLYYEEDILAERLINIGKTSYYCADSNVIHFGSVTVSGEKFTKKAYIKNMYNSMSIYLKDYKKYNALQVVLYKVLKLLQFYVVGHM